MLDDTETRNEAATARPGADEVSPDASSTTADAPVESRDDTHDEADADASSNATADAPDSSADRDSGDEDDGTPESDADPESDASEADELDDPAQDDSPSTAIAAEDEHDATGAIARDGTPHRRRRSDPPPVVFNYADAEREPVRRRRRRSRGRAGWIVTTVLLLGLLGGAIALNWHQWETTEQWTARSDELTQINYDLGTQLAEEKATTAQLEGEIDLLSQQLATSNQRVIDLSAAKAGAEDASEFAQQQINQLTEDLTTAASVATALNRCVDGQQQLAEYLRTPDNYEPEELAEFESSVDELCATAEDASSRLREDLAE